MLWVMVYHQLLAERVRNQLAGTPGLTERQMFGGIGWMIFGNMAVGVLGEGIVCRVGPDAYEALLAEPGAAVFDFTGRPMTGWLHVHADALDDEEALQEWIDHGVRFASGLPAKAK